MPSSAPADDLQSIAESLVAAHPVAIVDATGGGNNRLYKVRDGLGRFFALKSYPAHSSDPRDRLGAEFGALSFLAEQGGDKTPRAVSCDKERGFALYQWIDGAAVSSPVDADIDQVIDFMAQLLRLGTVPAAQPLPLASEACLSGREIMAQIARRRARFAEVAGTEPVLAAFLADEFDPLVQRAEAWARAGYAARAWSFDADLAQSCRALSPSDFGFHNALKQSDGNLVFIDFEYFGWDDPVKLTADFLQHPGMTLECGLLARFRTKAVAVYGAVDPGFGDRLDLLYPLIGLRWCMILLNEFLPERWFRRQFAGAQDSRQIVVERQLNKACHRLRATEEFVAGKGA